MKRMIRLAWILAGAPMILAATAGCGGRNAEEKTVDAVQVSVVKPIRKTLTRTTAQPARIEAYEQTRLYGKVSGYVKAVGKDIGDPVKKGEVLVKLWIPEMQDEFKQLEALIKQRQSERNQAAASVKTADAAIKTAEARVAEVKSARTRAEGDYKRWQAELKRISGLVKSGSLARKLEDETRQQFQSATAARQEADAKIKSADAALAESRALKEKAVADKKAADARIEVAERNRDRMKTLLNYAEIKAPFDGVVVQRTVDTGDFVQPSDAGRSKPLLVVHRIDKVRIVAEVPEVEGPFICCENGSAKRPGQEASEATIHVQVRQGKKIVTKVIAAKVTRTGWALNPANRTLRVEIHLDNRKGPLRPGMYATATLVLERRADVLAIPAAAVFNKNGKSFCCCVKDGIIVHSPLTCGFRTDQDVEIVAGLNGNEAVVSANPASLSSGQKVSIAHQ